MPIKLVLEVFFGTENYSKLHLYICMCVCVCVCDVFNQKEIKDVA